MQPDTEKTFIVTDSCMWERQKVEGTRHPHAIEVIDEKTGQVRFISSGSRVKFVSGSITESLNQEVYNKQ
ncbi:MAG: hypothetical protein WC767_03610 [Candidatus Paceibacterota bacterium]|jgi:hypothetical protein